MTEMADLKEGYIHENLTLNLVPQFPFPEEENEF